ncbi:MAG: hypothetical protein CM1200mP40_02170 [Gammaproteobacteria bacterium]|nr:MAG: hypothetical protein CM1200mP40_02170 [Gammaproteobacteria bacterium]
MHPEEKTPLSVIQQQVTQDFQRSRQITVRDTYIENLLRVTITVESSEIILIPPTSFFSSHASSHEIRPAFLQIVEIDSGQQQLFEAFFRNRK